MDTTIPQAYIAFPIITKFSLIEEYWGISPIEYRVYAIYDDDPTSYAN